MNIKQPRHRLQSPVPNKPHIWHGPVRAFFGPPLPPWVCANLAYSVMKFGGRGETPAAAHSDWQKQNRGTGRHG